MLVLKRRREQSVRLEPEATAWPVVPGWSVVFTITAIQNGAVTLSIEAPPWLKISREPNQLNGVNTNGKPDETRA